MGSRDRPGKEAKKKPKAKSGQPSCRRWRTRRRTSRSSASRARRSRSSRTTTGRGLTGGRTPSRPLRRPAQRIDEERDGPMAMTDERSSGAGDQAERGKAVDAALLAIEKQFGRGAIMKLGSRERQEVDFIPTGSIALDLALGVGGIPRGRITEIFGPESSGKTTVCQHVIAEAQARGGVVAFIDVEHALDPGLCPRLRRQRRRAPRQPAGHRRAGARDHRDADPLRRHRLRRRRLGRRARAARRDRRRDGRLVRRHPGPAHEPGAAQADRRRLALEHLARLHQPAAREDRRHVRQPGDDPRWPRPQVLRLGPAGHPARRDHQDRHGVGRQPGPRQGREEQGRRRRSGSPSSTSCTARASPRRAACWTSASRWTSCRKTGAWFNFGETRLGQGREASKEFLKANPADRRGDRAPHPRRDQRGRRSRSRASKRPSRSAARSAGRPSTRRVLRRAPASVGPRSMTRRSSSRPRRASSRPGRAPWRGPSAPDDGRLSGRPRRRRHRRA